jgi:hypothetical protein
MTARQFLRSLDKIQTSNHSVQSKSFANCAAAQRRATRLVERTAQAGRTETNHHPIQISSIWYWRQGSPHWHRRTGERLKKKKKKKKLNGQKFFFA